MTMWPVQMLSNERWPADIEIWHVEFAEKNACQGQMERLLDAEELARADRYRRPADRACFVATRSSLRELLGRHVGAAPASLRFVLGTHGRPALADHTELSFNVSHAGSHALIAISRKRTVGVDIERLDVNLDWHSLTGLVCTTGEQSVIALAPPTLQHAYFFRCWTAKEALLKALGLGITEGLLALSVQPDKEGLQQPGMAQAQTQTFADAAALRFHWLPDIAGYLACIAYSQA